MAQGGDLFRFLHATAAAHLALFSSFRTGRQRFRVAPKVIKLLFHRGVSVGDPGVINNYVVFALIFGQFSGFICASSDALCPTFQEIVSIRIFFALAVLIQFEPTNDRVDDPYHVLAIPVTTFGSAAANTSTVGFTIRRRI